MAAKYQRPAWREAVIRALQRYTTRHSTRVIERQRLITEELGQIVKETQSRSKVPSQTLSRVVQELRKEELVGFTTDRGTYILLDSPIQVETEDLPDELIDEAIKQDKLHIGDVPTEDLPVQARRRRGQDRLHDLTLENYGFKCALCDCREAKSLIASHIVRWADDHATRGHLHNVICLCRIHDALFEIGAVSLSDDLTVLKNINSQGQIIKAVMKMTTTFTPPLHHPPSPDYLRRHRQRVGFEV